MTKQNETEQLNRYQFIKLYKTYTYFNNKSEKNVSYMTVLNTLHSALETSQYKKNMSS